MSRALQKGKPIDPLTLLEAYAQGYFPMADSRTGKLSWYTADPRGVLDLPAFHVPKRLARTVRQGKFDLRIDTDFEGVVRGCAERDDTWISEDIVKSYVALHRLGYAHSIETWSGGALVGGLYGVSLGGAFFGESMFARATDASKVALVALVERLRARGYALLDTQMVTSHMEQFGATTIPLHEYLERLEDALRLHCTFKP